jgi:hypothetical protein
MEHLFSSTTRSIGMGGCMAATDDEIDSSMVDVRGVAGSSLFGALDGPTVGSEARGRSVLFPAEFRHGFDWSVLDRDYSCVGNSKMNDRRKAETIGELDTHFGYMMERLDLMSVEVKEVRSHFEEMANDLATKKELEGQIAGLRADVEKQSLKNIWKTLIWIFAGISAIAGGLLVLASVFKRLPF